MKKGRWSNVCMIWLTSGEMVLGGLWLAVLQIIEQQPLVPYYPNPTWGGRANVLRPEVTTLGRSGCI